MQNVPTKAESPRAATQQNCVMEQARAALALFRVQIQRRKKYKKRLTRPRLYKSTQTQLLSLSHGLLFISFFLFFFCYFILYIFFYFVVSVDNVHH